jgi:hypothetical protein
MPLPQGYRVVYIGWWDEPDPSDQTDLSNGGDWTAMAVGNRLVKDIDRWDPPRSTDLAQCQVAPPSEARLFVSSRFFSTWF